MYPEESLIEEKIKRTKACERIIARKKINISSKTSVLFAVLQSVLLLRHLTCMSNDACSFARTCVNRMKEKSIIGKSFFITITSNFH